MITSGFFNSVNGDRRYNADQVGNMFEGLIGEGVFESVGGKFEVTAGNGMNVNVATGRAVVDTKWIKSDNTETVAITAAHVSLPRYTIVVLRHVKADRTVILTTIDGTAAASPTVPSVVRNSTYYDICLAEILVPAAAVSIRTQDITDTRNDSSVCGYVTGLIDQVDTTTLYNQWRAAYASAEQDLEDDAEAFHSQASSLMANEQAEFMAWFDSLTEELRVDTYIQPYRAHFTVSSVSGVMPWTQLTPSYTYNTQDIITVHINGLLGVIGTDYSVSDSGITFLLLDTTSDAEVDVEVLRSRIGYNSESTSSDFLPLYGHSSLATEATQTFTLEYNDGDAVPYLFLGACYLDSDVSLMGNTYVGYTVDPMYTITMDEELLTSNPDIRFTTALLAAYADDTISMYAADDTSEATTVRAVYSLPDSFIPSSVSTTYYMDLIESRYLKGDNVKPVNQIVMEPSNDSKQYLVVAAVFGNKYMDGRLIEDDTVFTVKNGSLEMLQSRPATSSRFGRAAVSSGTNNIMAALVTPFRGNACAVQINVSYNADALGIIVYDMTRN